MRIMQEFGLESDLFIPSSDNAIRQIEKLPLPYTGNKKKLNYRIYEALTKNNIQFSSVLDAFSGSASVSLLFKMMGKKVIANDLLTSSYLNAVAFVENCNVRLSEEEKKFLLHNDNKHKGTFVEDNYLAVQERPEGHKGRYNKFTLKECRYLDNFRANIDELCGIYQQGLGLAANAAVVLRLPFGNIDQSVDVMKHRKRQESFYGKTSGKHDRRIGIYYDSEMNLNFNKWFMKYVNDFVENTQEFQAETKCKEVEQEKKIKRASFLVNLQQHILRDCFVGGRMHNGQVLAEIDTRLSHQKNQLKGTFDNAGSTAMDFFTQTGKPGQGMKWWSCVDMKLPGQCLATNADAIELLRSGMCDGIECCYFDPPYGTSSTNYSMLYRFLEEYIYSKPLEELDHITNFGHRFIHKKTYELDFIEMLESAKNIPLWLFSYNDTSWANIDKICEIIRCHKTNVILETLNEEYRYLYRSKQGRNKKGKEYLIIAR